MMDCKKVLVETDGDIDKAIELLREKGLAKAAKKAGRIAAEGLVKIAFSDDNKEAAVVEVNSETDFVAKNEEFVQFVEKLADMALTADSDDMEAFKALPYEGEGTVEEALSNKIAKIGENTSKSFIGIAGLKGGFGDIAASVDTLTSNTARTDDDIQGLLDDAESQIQGYLDEYAE